jgi:16S rRNA (guanine966-N2)-methyltransferase
MRVIAGKTKGHPLKVPKQTTTRPATDLVRGAIFSILENITDDWSYVLDLFSGSGSLGIEALSRGAGWVDFVDHDPRCCDIIKQNLDKTKFKAQAQVHCTTVEKAIIRLDKEYKVILIDPPYSDLTIGNLLTTLSKSKVVKEKPVIVVTHSPRLQLDDTYVTLNRIKQRRHGDSCIEVYQTEKQI